MIHTEARGDGEKKDRYRSADLREAFSLLRVSVPPCENPLALRRGHGGAETGQLSGRVAGIFQHPWQVLRVRRGIPRLGFVAGCLSPLFPAIFSMPAFDCRPPAAGDCKNDSHGDTEKTRFLVQICGPRRVFLLSVSPCLRVSV